MNEFKPETQHIGTAENLVADHLSRKLRVGISKPIVISNFKRKFNEKTFECKQSFNTIDFKDRIVKLHNFIVHIGAKQLSGILKSSTIVSKLSQTRRLLSKCIECNTCVHAKNKIEKVLGSFFTENSDEMITIYIAGPYNLEYEDEVYEINVISCIDNCTWFTEQAIIHDISATKSTQAIETIWIKKYCPPKRILFDHATQFCGKILIEVTKKYQIERHYRIVQNARGNGMVERINRTINVVLEIYRLNTHENDWTSLFLGDWIFHVTYNLTPSQSHFIISDFTDQTKRFNIMNFNYQKQFNVHVNCPMRILQKTLEIKDSN